MPATLLKRLGEAVDGYRTGIPVWVTADTTFPHRVWGVVASKHLADDLVTRHSGSRVFGPYVAVEPELRSAAASPSYTEAKMMSGQLPWPPKCMKQPDSQCIIVDTLRTTNTRFFPVSGTTITIKMSDGHQSQSISYPADSVSAVFFTMSSVDKMLIPYYTYLYGVVEAARLRREIAAQP